MTTPEKRLYDAFKNNNTELALLILRNEEVNVNHEFIKYHIGCENRRETFLTIFPYNTLSDEVFELLIQKGANVNYSFDLNCNSTNPPIFTLVSFNNIKRVKYILDHGYDITLLDHEKHSLFFHVNSPEMVHLLMQYNVKPCQEALPFLAYCGSDKIETIKALVEYPTVDINGRNRSGNTVLYQVLRSNWCKNEKQIELLKILLNKKANINIQNEDDNTVLHLAARLNHQKIVELLLYYGADMYIQNDSHKNVLDVSNERMKQYLLAFPLSFWKMEVEQVERYRATIHLESVPFSTEIWITLRHAEFPPEFFTSKTDCQVGPLTYNHQTKKLIIKDSCQKIQINVNDIIYEQLLKLKELKYNPLWGL